MASRSNSRLGGRSLQIPSHGKKTFRRVSRTGLIGLIVLGGCGTLRKELDPAKTTEGPYERVALGNDLRVAVNTFRPTGEYNPTSYLILGVGRDGKGKAFVSPFIGHFQNQGKGENYFWHLAAIPQTGEQSALLAGLGRTFAGEKGRVGVGGVLLRDEIIPEIATAFDLNPKTTITWSSDPRELKDSSVFNLKHGIGTFAGTNVIGYLEGGFNGKSDLRLGSSFERGKWALDLAYDERARAMNYQLARGFGPQGRHFFFVGLRDPEGEKPSFTFGINFTGYGLGRRKNQPRRRIVRKQTTANPNRPTIGNQGRRRVWGRRPGMRR